jgi:hypothetical protein
MNLLLRLAWVAAALAGASLYAQDCPDWDNQVAQLTPAQRDTLGHQGAVYAPGKTFVVGSSLVARCEPRLVVGAYVNSVLRGTADRRKRLQVRHYSNDLKSVVLKIWPGIGGSTVLPKDGALRDEAYGILWGLSSQDLVEVLRRLIASDGLNMELIHLILESRPAELRPDLVSYGKQTKILNQAIYAFGAVAALGSPEGPLELRAVAARPNLDATQREVIENLIKKATAKKRILSDDFLDLEYEP